MPIDKALDQIGATSCCRSRHLTTVGTGWSLAGPPHKGKQSWPSPGGGRGNHSLSYQHSRGRGISGNESNGHSDVAARTLGGWTAQKDFGVADKDADLAERLERAIGQIGSARSSPRSAEQQRCAAIGIAQLERHLHLRAAIACEEHVPNLSDEQAPQTGTARSRVAAGLSREVTSNVARITRAHAIPHAHSHAQIA